MDVLGRGDLGHGAMGCDRISGRGQGMIARASGGFGGHGQGSGALTCSVLTKEQLDNQLDAHMLKMKGQPDAELDACMAQTDLQTND